ncbi:ATP-binding protein [Paenibacillus timonensis]|uniref:ATP-binding protein n=1 Tax=Paenibacillus timonensis TaxID=225915 RepID=A0ABW3S7N2_9BACL|nr:ATP-binding protein [Paenibacillus timonensis]MCH1638935.1 ATP-binding protein [Paenibacillus timonensis]
MASNKVIRSVDVTPNPRILRTLGEIPFEPWQCFAEFIDNSIDAMEYADSAQIPLSKKQIIISWSSETTAAVDRRVEIRDTGPGMDLDTIRDAVKAGYSSKGRTSELGLFGMGFNISTARLGDETLFLSTKPGDLEWIGVQIDFESMINNEHYDVPVVSLEKGDPNEHGTRVVIRKLKPGIFEKLRRTESQIKSTIEDVYSPILSSNTELEILVQSKKCKPTPYCVWGESRYVIHSSNQVPAIIPINEVVGISLFDVSKNRYLSYEEEEVAYELNRNTGTFPPDVIEREKRVTGWLGIQRYSDTSLFGIDFIRNGRKILRKDKTLFNYYIDISGTSKLEYPTELGSTWGGRIVGEIHVDHLIPTYQKNDFDRTDKSWYELVNIIRGDGPILPKTRTELGYSGPNTSPLGSLVRAFSRMDPGTKNLAIPRETAREWKKKFEKNDPDYQADTKWYEAAQQCDQERANRGASSSGPVNIGSNPSDDPDGYGPPSTSTGSSGQGSSINTSNGTSGTNNSGKTSGTTVPQDEFAELISRSIIDIALTRAYRYKTCPSAIEVEVRRLTSGIIGSGTEGEPVFWDTRNIRELKFFYNPSHQFFMSWKTTPHEVMLLHLAETFRIRDRLDKTISSVYIELLEEMFPEERIDQLTIQERADNVFERIRTASTRLLSSREAEVLDAIHEHAGDLEDTLARLMSSPDLQVKLQTRAPGGISSIVAVPNRTLLRLISKFPEEFFDGKFFRINYQSLVLPTQEATERIRDEAKERILTYIKDALWVLSPLGAAQRGNNQKRMRDELLRCSHSLDLLEEVICD